jgi:hypothetical protein
MADGTNRVIDDTKIQAWAKLPHLFSVITGLTIQSTEPRTIKPVAERSTSSCGRSTWSRFGGRISSQGRIPREIEKEARATSHPAEWPVIVQWAPQLETHTVLTRSYTSG